MKKWLFAIIALSVLIYVFGQKPEAVTSLPPPAPKPTPRIVDHYLDPPKRNPEIHVQSATLDLPKPHKESAAGSQRKTNP